MTVEAILQNLGLFAELPNAIGKLRELILTLAVQGKLVSQNAEDEPASSLLELLPNQLPLEKRNRLPKALPAIENPPSEIPKGWTWARFQEVAFIASNLVDPSNYSDAKHLAPDNIQKGNGILLPCQTIREDKVKSAKHRFFAGQLIYSKIRPNLSKAAIVNFDGLCSADMYPIDSLIEPGYLLRFILSNVFLRQAVKNDTRIAMPKINQEELNAIAVAVPPLAEQKRIVAKVDELMALCDRLEAEQKEREAKHAHLARAALARFAEAPTPGNLDYLFHPSYTIDPVDLRKSILTMAVQGKLLDRVKSDGAGQDILAKHGLSSERPDDAYSLPTHWAWSTLGNLATRMDSGWSPACPPESAPSDAWGVLRTTAVQTLKYQESANKLLPPNLIPRPEHEVFDGDILFTRAGPMNRVGIICVARPTRPNLMISDKIVRLHLLDGIDPDFAALAMNAGYSSSVIEGLKSGMAASQVNISQSKLRSVPIPVPPLAEQRLIVAKVDALMALVDQLEAQLAESRAVAERLMEAVVAELTRPSTGEASIDAAMVRSNAEAAYSNVPRIEVKAPSYLPGQVTAYIARQLSGDPHLGRTKMEKVRHFVEYVAGVPLRRVAKPYKFGPYDGEQVQQVERWAAERGAFTTIEPQDGGKVEFRPGPNVARLAAEGAEQLGDRRAEVDRIIGLLRHETKERCELFATAYTAWNDLLLRGQTPTDPAIMEEIRTHWHERKQAFSDKQWRIALNWLRMHGLVPTGTGRAVVA